MPRNRTCRGCGCTDTRACIGGCSWVLIDVRFPTGICSACAQVLEWDPQALAEVGLGEEPPRRIVA